jgi:catechol 2,3-dioxygenase-like lactoylglutathione lyase family enzyme
VPAALRIEVFVRDLDAFADFYTRVLAFSLGAGWSLAGPLQQRSWGLTDFRVHDPDGHYIRITNRR